VVHLTVVESECPTSICHRTALDGVLCAANKNDRVECIENVMCKDELKVGGPKAGKQIFSAYLSSTRLLLLSSGERYIKVDVDIDMGFQVECVFITSYTAPPAAFSNLPASS
jgi:hypothetical protein